MRPTEPAQWRSGRLYRMDRAPLGPGDVVRRGPFRMTSVTRTLVDCRREWPLEDAVVAMDAALLGDRTTTRELLGVASGMPGWPGAQRARGRSNWPTGVRSPRWRRGGGCEWSGPSSLLDEKRREDGLRALDIRVVRITEADLDSGRATVERRLAGLLTTAGPAHPLFTATPRNHG